MQRLARFFLFFAVLVLLSGFNAWAEGPANGPNDPPANATPGAYSEGSSCNYGCGAGGCKCGVTAEQMYKIITEEFYKKRDLPARKEEAKQQEQGNVNQAMQNVRNFDAAATNAAVRQMSNQAVDAQKQISGSQNQACSNYSATAGTPESSSSAYNNLSNDPSRYENPGSKTSPDTLDPRLVTAIAVTAKDTPAAQSPYENAIAVVKSANEVGTCDKTAAGGIMANFCSNDANVGKDSSLDLLSDSNNVTLNDEKRKIALNLVRNIASPYPSIVPISKSLIVNGGLDKQNKEIQDAIAAQKILEARYGVASYPYRKEIAMRKEGGANDMYSILHLSDGSSQPFTISAAGRSAASLEKQRFYDIFLSAAYPAKLINTDTKKDIEIAYNTGLLNAITYLIREEQRETNKLLGGIYAELLSQRAEKVSIKNASINGGASGTATP